MKLMRCLAVVLMLAPAAVFAEMRCGDCDKGGMEKMGGMKMGQMREGMQAGMDYAQFKKELNLTDDQVKQLQSIRTECAKAQVKREADIKVARIDMTGLMKKDTPDFAGIREKEKQVSALELEGKLAMVDCREKSYNVLTKEQQAKLPALMKEKMEKRMEMRKEDGMKGPMKGMK